MKKKKQQQQQQKNKQKQKKTVENFPGCSAYAGAYHLTFRRAALERGGFKVAGFFGLVTIIFPILFLPNFWVYIWDYFHNYI